MYKEMIESQRKFFLEQKTKSYQFRIDTLKKLKQAIIDHEKEILDALNLDLGKSHSESFMTEVGVVLSEISYAIKHLKKWMKPRKKKTPLLLYKAKSYVVYEPYGNVLVLAPWNYPFQLTVNPIVGAIASGNTVVAKPSSSSKYTAIIIDKIVKEVFAPEHVYVVLGSSKEADKLLDEKFDYIFFTGSIPIGKHIMRKASEHLTPVTLELGGKSPCIIDRDMDLNLVAKRVAFGKLINAGQTCIAPDYVYIQKEDADTFIKHYKKHVETFYGTSPLDSEHYPKIINEHHLNRLKTLIENEKVAVGGKANDYKLEPTVLSNITWESKVMQDEIFGPILPILIYSDYQDIIQELKTRDKPLALYLFTKNKKMKKDILNQVSFGGGTINDTLMHFVNHHMGFGGVGYSGMGHYHGKQSFKTFSHEKSILDRATWIDLSMRYHPHSKSDQKIIKKILK